MEKDPKISQEQEKEVIYSDNHTSEYFIRTIKEDVDPMSLIWHKDEYTREIEVLQSNKWRFQYDNKLPFELENGDKFRILSESIHRVIKGEGDLVIRIKEIK